MLIEDLFYKCNLNASTSKWFNNCAKRIYSVYSDTHKEECVYTGDDLHEGEFIGYITGEKKYTWDVPPNKYCIWLNDYYIIDCTSCPRCVTANIRKTQNDDEHNCTMGFAYVNNSVDVYVLATKPIRAGSELVMKPEQLDDY